MNRKQVDANIANQHPLFKFSFFKAEALSC